MRERVIAALMIFGIVATGVFAADQFSIVRKNSFGAFYSSAERKEIPVEFSSGRSIPPVSAEPSDTRDLVFGRSAGELKRVFDAADTYAESARMCVSLPEPYNQSLAEARAIIATERFQSFTSGTFLSTKPDVQVFPSVTLGDLNRLTQSLGNMSEVLEEYASLCNANAQIKNDVSSVSHRLSQTGDASLLFVLRAKKKAGDSWYRRLDPSVALRILSNERKYISKQVTQTEKTLRIAPEQGSDDVYELQDRADALHETVEVLSSKLQELDEQMLRDQEVFILTLQTLESDDDGQHDQGDLAHAVAEFSRIRDRLAAYAHRKQFSSEAFTHDLLSLLRAKARASRFADAAERAQPYEAEDDVEDQDESE